MLFAGCNPGLSIGTLYKNAETSFKKGDLKTAVDRTESGLRRCGSSLEWCWKFRLLKAESLMAQGENKTAVEFLKGSVDPPTIDLKARLRMDQGWALYYLSDLSPGEKELREAHSLAELSGSPLLVAEVEMRQASFLIARRSFGEAETTLRHALELAAHSGDSFILANLTGNLGHLFQTLFRYDEAIYWFKRALALSESIGAANLTAATVGNLGLCYLQLGDLESALKNFAAAEALTMQAGSRRQQQLWIGNSGDVFLATEDFPSAIDRYSRALKIAEELSEKASRAMWLTSLAKVNIRIGQWDSAERYNNQSIAIGQGLKNKVGELYNDVNSAQIAVGRKQYQLAEERFRRVADSLVEDPTPELEARHGLADLYIETGAPQKAETEFRSAIATIESRQAGLTKEDYKLSYLSNLVRFYQSYVDILVQRGASNEALEVVESSRARLLKERTKSGAAAQASPSASQFQAMARNSGRILLSYWLGPKRSYVWAITPAKIQIFNLPPEKEIRALVETYRTIIEELGDPLESQNPAGTKLSKLLLGPIRELVRPGSHVVIVPDGALHSLNFATLPGAEHPNKYWIEDATISVVPSLGLALNAHLTRKLSRPSLLAIGDPEPAGEEFPRLPNAGKEVDAIAEMFSQPNKAVYKGPQALPSIYRGAVPGRFSFIHFAAHATANRASPLDSALILSREGNVYTLIAREVMEIPLNASVVTLSSCRSAGAHAYSGEGLVGLTWAFLEAGAQHVIAGLWDVDDQATSQLMSGMYADLTRDVAPDDALRSAQLKLSRGEYPYNKPYYWGPFQVYSRTAKP
ncbi:MAG TPA: CHAT domain-containing tetratricopeptide repeat protein [Bryobacteraceae bacterium]|nr:CHAT domain-containing tetratricopeptide repeat protein [Bryobacteraceae bacterium]